MSPLLNYWLTKGAEMGYGSALLPTGAPVLTNSAAVVLPSGLRTEPMNQPVNRQVGEQLPPTPPKPKKPWKFDQAKIHPLKIH